MQRCQKTVYGFAALLALALSLLMPAGVRSQNDQTNAGTESYLNLVIRLSDKGSAEIVRASVINELLIEPNAPVSDYLYEVNSGTETLAVGFLPEDPFITRAFGGPGAREKIDRARSVTIVINVPSFDKADGCRLVVRFYKIEAGEKPERLNAEVLRQLRAQRRLSLQFEIPKQKLRAALCKDAKHANP